MIKTNESKMDSVDKQSKLKRKRSGKASQKRIGSTVAFYEAIGRTKFSRLPK